MEDFGAGGVGNYIFNNNYLSPETIKKYSQIWQTTTKKKI